MHDNDVRLPFTRRAYSDNGQSAAVLDGVYVFISAAYEWKLDGSTCDGYGSLPADTLAEQAGEVRDHIPVVASCALKAAVEVSRRPTTVKICAWGSREIDALRARLRPAAHDSRRVDGESAGRWHARITRTIVLAVRATALQHAASMPPRIGGSDGATTAITQLYRSAVKLRACAGGLAAHFSEAQFRASSLAHSKAGPIKHARGFTMDGVRHICWILHRRVKSLAHALLKARRQEGTNVLAQLKEADRIADDKGRAYAINLALR